MNRTSDDDKTVHYGDVGSGRRCPEPLERRGSGSVKSSGDQAKESGLIRTLGCLWE
jgi:hypothetical protein